MVASNKKHAQEGNKAAVNSAVSSFHEADGQQEVRANHVPPEPSRTPDNGMYLTVQDQHRFTSLSLISSHQNTSPTLGVAGSSADEVTSLSTPNECESTKHVDNSQKCTKREEDGSITNVLAIQKPLSSSHKLHDIPQENVRKSRRLSIAKNIEEVLKLSATEMEKLTAAPESLPITSPPKFTCTKPSLAPSPILERKTSGSEVAISDSEEKKLRSCNTSGADAKFTCEPSQHRYSSNDGSSRSILRRPCSSKALSKPSRANSRVSSDSKITPAITSPKKKPLTSGAHPEPLDLNYATSKKQTGYTKSVDPPSPAPPSIPIPPMSIPTYLQLELSSSRPSPLYIYRATASEHPYESSKIKFERLLNFLIIPPQLEQVLLFGSLACLDAWLYIFTILPLRFLNAAIILMQWWSQVLAKEAHFISGFIYHGSGRMWHRQCERRETPPSQSGNNSRGNRSTAPIIASYQAQLGRAPETGNQSASFENPKGDLERRSKQGWGRKHRRIRSEPSSLSSYNKADLLQGALVICSCIILMKLDASRLYHYIRGQAAIKLYVIFNVLEVGDKLLAALGQDIFECLLSNETLERNTNGRSKIIQPLGIFFLGLVYNVCHSAALFFQVITLNVAVNSYSNALITLLMSNQFVEIKSTVFKRIEKDNLFQLTCADIVERFQLWLILVIIALRNIVEMGGLNVLGGGVGSEGDLFKETTVPVRSNSILPNSFTILPSWSGEVLSPFVLVLGSEMLVDWIKHSYIGKFNNVKPAIYGRYLDVLAKDYYTNAFVNQDLTKRLGLPVIPLACLFMRSSVQTYHMFLATYLPPPIRSTATELSVESAMTSPATTAALEHFDNIIRRALGRSTFGVPDPAATNPWYLPSTDDMIAALTMLVFFLGAFFVLLACKLVLGMLLLKFARNRYRLMKSKERQSFETDGKRLGIWGITELDDDKKRWFYDDDQEKLRKVKEKEKASRERAVALQDFGKISRYEMLKRIW